MTMALEQGYIGTQTTSIGMAMSLCANVNLAMKKRICEAECTSMLVFISAWLPQTGPCEIP